MRYVVQKSWKELKSIWQTLYTCNSYATAYQSYEYLTKTKKGIPEVKHPFDLITVQCINFVLYIDDVPYAIAPLLIKKAKKETYAFIRGEYSQVDYLDILYRADFSYEDFAYFMDTIKRKLGNIKLAFNRISEKTLTYRYCLRYFQSGPSKMEPCVSIPVNDGYAKWLDSLSGKKRNRIRNSYRRLAQDHLKCRVVFYYGKPVELKTVIKMMRLLALHVFRYNHFDFGIINSLALFLLAVRKFLDPMTRMLLNSKMSYNIVVYINDDIAAYSNGLICNDGRIINARGVINREFLNYRPIGLLLNAGIKDVCEKNERGELHTHEYDLCTGDQDYKYEFGGKTHYYYDFES